MPYFQFGRFCPFTGDCLYIHSLQSITDCLVGCSLIDMLTKDMGPNYALKDAGEWRLCQDESYWHTHTRARDLNAKQSVAIFMRCGIRSRSLLAHCRSLLLPLALLATPRHQYFSSSLLQCIIQTAFVVLCSENKLLQKLFITLISVELGLNRSHFIRHLATTDMIFSVPCDVGWVKFFTVQLIFISFIQWTWASVSLDCLSGD